VRQLIIDARVAQYRHEGFEGGKKQGFSRSGAVVPLVRIQTASQTGKASLGSQCSRSGFVAETALHCSSYVLVEALCALHSSGDKLL
jgi:hypothetical protein